MNQQLKNAGRIAILAAFISLFGLSRAHALVPACQDVFQSKKSTDSRDPRDLSARRSVDLATKQTREEHFVQINADRGLYVDYLKPAPGKPTIVLINGLTYRTGVWDKFVAELKGDGLGILRYDPVGMGKTMQKYGAPTGPVTITQQAQDLNSLLNALGIHDKIHLLGLSYGGGVAIEFTATYPDRVQTLIPMAAYTAALPAQVKQIMMKIAWVRTWMPYDRRTDAELYSYFLKQTVYLTFPLSEPIVLEHPYKLESVYRLSEGATSFNAEFFIDKLPPGVLHQVDARKDQYIPADIPQAFWDKIPNHVRASRIIIDMSEHKIPEAYPDFSANWVKLIIAKDPRIQDGTTWNGTGILGQAYSGNRRINVN